MEFIKCTYADLGYTLKQLESHDIKFITETSLSYKDACECNHRGLYSYTIFYIEKGKK
ncbi:MAG: hypothetical protein K0S01_2438 [Herbinix sp.]|jgi:hypothetical protein|nr:hypothetical protein [Herbinix sp.]